MKFVASHTVDKVGVAFHELDGSLAGRYFEYPQAPDEGPRRDVTQAAGNNDLAFMRTEVLEVSRLVVLAYLQHLRRVFEEGDPAHVWLRTSLRWPQHSNERAASVARNAVVLCGIGGASFRSADKHGRVSMDD